MLDEIDLNLTKGHATKTTLKYQLEMNVILLKTWNPFIQSNLNFKVRKSNMLQVNVHKS